MISSCRFPFNEKSASYACDDHHLARLFCTCLLTNVIPSLAEGNARFGHYLRPQGSWPRVLDHKGKRWLTVSMLLQNAMTHRQETKGGEMA